MKHKKLYNKLNKSKANAIKIAKIFNSSSYKFLIRTDLEPTVTENGFTFLVVLAKINPEDEKEPVRFREITIDPQDVLSFLSSNNLKSRLEQIENSQNVEIASYREKKYIDQREAYYSECLEKKREKDDEL